MVVTLSDPIVSGFSGYGTYLIKLAAKRDDDGNGGTGVAEGAQFTLVLQAATPPCTDSLEPIVTPVAPKGMEQKLGQSGVSFTAIDPTGTCENGIVSIGYSVKSAGGTDYSTMLGTLSESPTLAQPAGVLVTATGSFMPEGWSGTDGTVNGVPFTGSFLSGIGTYTITETASDGVHTATATDKFSVDYSVAFATAVVNGGSHCDTAGGPGCQVHFKFTVSRSNDTSDGAFMVDETVAVVLRTGTTSSAPGAGNYVTVHFYGCDSPFSYVQIQTTTNVACIFSPTPSANVYVTNFKRGDFGATTPGTYVADVWFRDVDDNWTYEGSSPSVTF